MNKNTKKIYVKNKPKIVSKNISTEKVVSNLEFKTNDWAGNIFDSYLSDDIKQIMGSFFKSSNFSMCGTIEQNVDNVNLVKDMFKQLSDNVSRSIENNVELGQDFLKCRTITDMIELNKKALNSNIKLSTAIYFDLFNDAQNISNHTVRNSSDYITKHMKCYF